MFNLSFIDYKKSLKESENLHKMIISAKKVVEEILHYNQYNSSEKNYIHKKPCNELTSGETKVIYLYGKCMEK